MATIAYCVCYGRGDYSDITEYDAVFNEEDFEPESPFDAAYSLIARFTDNPEEMPLGEEEATRTLMHLFGKANGDYSTIRDYVDRCKGLYEGEYDDEFYEE